ncbi:BTAD domain-containing putative transcriptional regulator [Nonomuraea fuscirosea]|uniref:AfsR/SARP family transcriptional regulator n=1 Tax=Nonomuraea fuscirosea TaxID=1291556 RepID=UPI0034268726
MTEQRSSEVRIELLGSFRCTVEGGAVPLAPLTQKLVAFVALHRSMTRFALQQSLWPEMDRLYAGKRLSQALWRVRSATGETVLRVTEHQVELRQGVDVDFAVGIHLAEQVARAQTDKSSLAGVADVTTVNWECLGRELLPGWDSVEIEQARARWDITRGIALQRLARAYLALGDPLVALDLALRATHIDPFNERSHQVLAEAHLALGDTVRAGQVYAQYSELLRLEVGRRPSAEFRRAVLAE